VSTALATNNKIMLAARTHADLQMQERVVIGHRHTKETNAIILQTNISTHNMQIKIVSISCGTSYDRHAPATTDTQIKICPDKLRHQLRQTTDVQALIFCTTR
jgi:hypothetical protein